MSPNALLPSLTPSAPGCRQRRRRQNSRPAAPRRPVVPRLEVLEDRTVPSLTVTSPSDDGSSGRPTLRRLWVELVLRASAGRDDQQRRWPAGQPRCRLPDPLRLEAGEAG